MKNRATNFKLTNAIWLIVIAISCIKCTPPEIAVEAHKPGLVTQSRVNLGEHYNQVIWFDLTENQAVKTVDKYLWHLQISNNSKAIFLNGAIGMQGYKTNLKSVEESADLSSIELDIDRPSLHVDSLLFSAFNVPSAIYYLDLGYNNQGESLGSVYCQILDSTDTSIEIAYRLSNSNQVEFETIELDAQRKTAFSFFTKASFIIEPEYTDWQLCFTGYMHAFLNPNVNYLVNGVLVNTRIAEVANYLTLPFDSVTIHNAFELEFNQNANAIGYDWKYYNFSTSSYEVHSNRVYVIHNKLLNSYYKLRFLDFYDESGKKGSPLFEYQQL